jgi:aspartate aminotransferase
MQHIARNILSTAGGERARYVTAQKPKGVIYLDTGDPAFPTPEHIREAAKEALDQGFTNYAPGRGDADFLQAVCDHIELETGASYSPDEVFATHGATSGIYTVMTTFLEAGDEVILFDPTYSLYAHVARMLGAVPVPVRYDSEYHLDLEAVRAAVTPRTRMIFLNNPNNPTGVVCHRFEVESLAELCAEKDLLLVSDEAYAKILQPGYKHIPLLSLQEYRERLILINTLSKTYAMTGWRLGYLVAPRRFIPILLSVHRSLTGPISTFIQRAGIAALRGPQDCVADMATQYHRRGALMFRLAKEIPGFVPNVPQGGYYLFCRYQYPLTAAAMRKRLQEAGVATRSGTEFGAAGEGHLRLSYAGDESTIEKGMRIVREVCSQLAEG